MRSFPPKRGAPALAAFLAAFAVLTLVFFLDRLEHQRRLAERRADVLNSASAVRARLETALNSRIFLARGLMIHVTTHPDISRAEFDELAHWLITTQNGILALQLAKDTRVSHIYPLKGNERALGFDILADPAQQDAARRAIENRTAIFAGPVNLVQGGSAFITRMPIFLTPPGGKPGSGRYWGLAQVLIDADELYREAGLYPSSNGLDFALRGADGMGASGKVFQGNPRIFEADPVKLDVTLPYGSWQLAAIPHDGWQTRPTHWLRLVGGLLAVAAAMLAWFLVRAPQRLQERIDQASRALLENEARTQTLFDQAPFGMALLDTSGTVKECNAAFEKMSGIPRPDILGTIILRPPTDMALAEALRHAQAGTRSIHETGDVPLGKVPGSHRYVFQPIRLGDAVTSILLFVEDISERRNAEMEIRRAHDELENRVEERTRELANTNRVLEALIEERERAGVELQEKLHFIQVLLDAIPNPVFYKDREGRYLGCNQAFAAALGRRPDDIIGKTVFDLAPADLAKKYHEMDEALLLNPGHQVYEHEVVMSDGAAHSIIFNKATLNDAEGRVSGLVGVMVDITGRKQEQEKIAAAEAMFRGLVEQSLVGIYIIQDSKFVYVNPTFASIFGYDGPEEIINRLGPIDLTVEEDQQRAAEYIRQRIVGEAENVRYSFKGVRRDGSLADIEVQGRASQYNGHPAVIGILLDVTERLRAERQLNYLAFYDVLTGLPNRTLFMDHLKLASAGAKRHGTMMALHFLDLDRFKEINDTLGHHIGDQLLKSVAFRLQNNVRDTDTVARLGGDEFAIIQTDLPNIEGAEQLAQKIIEATAAPFNLEGNAVFTSTSIGITVYPLEDDNPEQLLKNADMAMYAAKSQGRNNFQFFSTTMNEEAHSRMHMQAGIRQGLEQDEFLLYYQPKVNLHNGRIVGAEALMRWRTAEGRIIPPSEFIPVAEDSGLIVPLGELALRMACRQNKAWQHAGLTPLRISVNLSPVQFKRQNIIETVTAVLRETGLAPSYLELEITESLLMQNNRATVDALDWLRELGVQVSVDDFGTGYSSLNYLKQLPVDTLKIDRSFIDDIPNNADDIAITKSVISLGHHLNLRIIAEGVETAAQADFLLMHGCDEAQGYYFGKPVPPEEFEKMLAIGTLPLA